MFYKSTFLGLSVYDRLEAIFTFSCNQIENKKWYQVARTIHNCTHIQYYEGLATAKAKVGLLSLLVVVVITIIIVIIIIIIFTVIAIKMEIPSTFQRGAPSSPWQGRQNQDNRRPADVAGTERTTVYLLWC
jgi:cytoskeletal protein RodZ